MTYLPFSRRRGCSKSLSDGDTFMPYYSHIQSLFTVLFYILNGRKVDGSPPRSPTLGKQFMKESAGCANAGRSIVHIFFCFLLNSNVIGCYYLSSCAGGLLGSRSNAGSSVPEICSSCFQTGRRTFRCYFNSAEKHLNSGTNVERAQKPEFCCFCVCVRAPIYSLAFDHPTDRC